MVKVENLKAISGGKDVEIEYLGGLVWTSISDVLKIPTENLKTVLTEVGLERFMPRPIVPQHAFRRVTKTLESKKNPFGKDKYTNLLVRDVKSEAGEVIRQLVREVVDGENVRLDYKPVIQMKIKEGGALAVTALVNDLTPEEDAVINNLPQKISDAYHFYDGTHVRYMIKVILNQCAPVSVRPSGGVDFVPQKYMETIEATKQLCRKLNSYEGNIRMWSIPVIDASEHREMIEESLEEQVMGGSLSLIQEMKKIMEDPARTITPKLVQGYAEKIKKMKEMVEEYEEKLEFQATKARENLELARMQAIKFMETVTEITEEEAK